MYLKRKKMENCLAKTPLTKGGWRTESDTKQKQKKTFLYTSSRQLEIQFSNIIFNTIKIIKYLVIHFPKGI